MKVRTVQMIKFKRFDDLTIDLGENPKKIVALVGPNGSGKSSVFDAFEEKLKDSHNPGDEDPSFYSKAYFYIDDEARTEIYRRRESIVITNDRDDNKFDVKSFRIRTSYRYTSKINVTQVVAQEDQLTAARPNSSMAVDNRLVDNYSRLQSANYNEWQNGRKSGRTMMKQLIGRVNEILAKVLDVSISNLGNVLEKRGSLFFQKENVADFPYANLSAGEKEVVDIVIDLIVSSSKYNDTVYCIDEPELHLNTRVQRSLLVEIEKLIPDNCQLWIATHSVGFLRALQEELKDKSQILDFSEKDLFVGTKTIRPIQPTRQNWQQIFQTAIDDLAFLVAPKRIVYCEGRADPAPNNAEQGLDAQVYNHIFAEEFSDTLFVSGGGNDILRNSTLAIQVVNKAFRGVGFLRLKDKDEKTNAERTAFLAEDRANRMLARREIENYLFDREVLSEFCRANAMVLDEVAYDAVVHDVVGQDLKLVQQSIKNLVRGRGRMKAWKESLKTCIPINGAVYNELKNCIFHI